MQEASQTRWTQRQLPADRLLHLYLDAIYPKVCCDGKIVLLHMASALRNNRGEG